MCGDLRWYAYGSISAGVQAITLPQGLRDIMAVRVVGAGVDGYAALNSDAGATLAQVQGGKIGLCNWTVFPFDAGDTIKVKVPFRATGAAVCVYSSAAGTLLLGVV